MDKLTEHYGELLGLDESWEAAEVDLDLAGLRVEIRLTHRGGPVTCAECGPPTPYSTPKAVQLLGATSMDLYPFAPQTEMLMNIPFLKAKKDAIQFSRQFYDTYLFSQNGLRLVSTYADAVYRFLCEADPSFSRVQLVKLKDELLSLQLEMIGTAWTHKSKEIAAIASSEFTKRFLEENGRANLWEIMGQYNQIVAESAMYGWNSSTATGRTHIAFMNTMRADLFDSWFARGHDGEAVARVVNRIGSEQYWKKGITTTMLGVRAVVRLDFEGNDTIAEKLAAVAFGFYQGAKEALDGVKLTA